MLFSKREESMCKTHDNKDRGYPKTKTPTTPKGYRSFARVVNFLSLICSEFQKLLKLVYDLTQKGRVFPCGTEQQKLELCRLAINIARFFSFIKESQI